jgi:hypothetical protein
MPAQAVLDIGKSVEALGALGARTTSSRHSAHGPLPQASSSLLKLLKAVLSII